MSNTRILLVEDEYMIRLILAESLEGAGLQVVEARTGDEAMLILGRDARFDAVVTDIHMPGKMDGVAVGRKIRIMVPAIPVIYVTGQPDTMNALKPLSPLEILVRKPYKPSQVLAALRGLLHLAMPQAAGPGSGGEGQ